MESGILSWFMPGSTVIPNSHRNATEDAVQDGKSTITWGGVVPNALAITFTYISWVGTDTTLIEADVVMNAYVPWTPYASDVDAIPPYANSSVEGVARHEYGHLLGASSHEDRYIDVMNTNYSFGGNDVPKLHADDRNGARWAYPGGGTEVDLAPTGWMMDISGNATPVPTPSPTIVSTGQYLTATVSVENLGTQNANNFSVGMYLSASRYSIVGGYFLGTFYKDLPGAGGNSGVVPLDVYNVAVLLNCNVAPGTYYVWAVVDDDQTFTESSEDNNAIALPYPENPYQITVQSSAPTAPSGLVATDNLCDRVSLSWADNSNNETGFRILRNDTTLAITAANTTTYVDHPVPGIVNSYKVRAVGPSCESADAQDTGKRLVTITTPPTVTASTGNCDGIHVDWTWTVQGIDGFKVYRDGGGTPVYTGTDPTERTWLDTSTGVGDNHSYQVAAYNICGTGPGGSANGVRIAAPATIALLFPTSDHCSDIALSWTWGGLGQSGFIIYRDGLPIFTAGASPPYTYVDAGVSIGSHLYAIAAFYPGSCNGPSSATATGFRRGPPTSQPQNVTASDFECGVVNVAWTWGGTGQAGFKVFRNDTLAMTIANPSTFSWVDNTIPSGVTKNYTVKAYNDCGDGPTSNPPEPGTRWTTPPTGSLAATATGTGYCCTGVQLSWTWGGVGQLGFRIYRDGTPVDTANGSGRSWFDAQIAGGSTHDYLVAAYNKCGEGAQSNHASGTRCSSVISIRVNSNVPGIKITKDGQEYTLTGNTITIPDSVCTTAALGTPAVQNASGSHYCFGSWSDGGTRNHVVTLAGDSTFSLGLISSGLGPTTVPAGSTLYDDIYDCRSPYIFGGDASLTTTNPTDTINVWGNVDFRFPTWHLGGPPRAGLYVYRPLRVKGATFETVDSSSATSNNLWLGVVMANSSTVYVDSCTFRNASGGILQYDTCNRPMLSAVIQRSTFEANVQDVNLWFDHTRSPTVTIANNGFYDAQALRIGMPSSTLAPAGTVRVDSNYFYTCAPLLAQFELGSGWQGGISGNTFTLNQDQAIGLWLRQAENDCGTTSAHASPSVVVSNVNRFVTLPTISPIALKAPKKTALVTQINATNNDWRVYTSTAIANLIADGTDASLAAESLAVVSFTPFYEPPGGGGGGGGGGSGGCPFVLTENAGGFTVENSILGKSEFIGAAVSDAYPLQNWRVNEQGRVRIRIAELESETDEIDEVSLGAVVVPDGYELATDPSGKPVLMSRTGPSLKEIRWSGKGAPFVSPVSPGMAYQGDVGDSVEFSVDPNGTVLGRRELGITMVHKQPSGSTPGAPYGVTIRVSPDDLGDRWITLDRVIPREFWSTDVFPIDMLGDRPVKRVRLVWHSQHTLGWIGVVPTRDASPRILPLLLAQHSSGRSVLEDLQAMDGKSVQLLPQEYVDLTFDASTMEPGATLVVLANGRYYSGAAIEAVAPARYSLEQNHPNPFNPYTQIDYSLPAASQATIRVYNIVGRLVRTLVNATVSAGKHTVTWDGRDGNGTQVSSGIYFYEFRAGSYSDRLRMILLR